MTHDLIRIDVCCNDPDNGLFDHRAAAIHAYDLIELGASSWDRPPRFVETTTGFRLAGKNWHTHGSKEWFGNWCWNAYWLDENDAADFFVWLHARKLFDVEQAEERLFAWWKRDDPLNREFVHRQLVKAKLNAQREHFE